MTTHEDLKTELLRLNQQWQKIAELEGRGFFEGKSQEFMDINYAQMGEISKRAEEIWLKLGTENPALLKGVDFLDLKAVAV